MKTNKHNDGNEFRIKDYGFICIWGILMCTGIMILPGLF